MKSLSHKSHSLKNHKYLRTYNLNWFVNNVEPNLKIINPKKIYSFLELVKFYLENQLENNNTIFEVKIK